MISPLLTDLYQLTMAYGYWKRSMHEREAVFHLFFRRAPFGGDGAIVAGVESAIDFLEGFAFNEDDLCYLASLTGANDQPLFERAFLDYLADLSLTLDVHAIPEGHVVLGNEPILRVRGSLLQCQLVETALLNIVNFQTLIATKAARICDAAEGDPVLEFGLRRAQGPDGGLSASRAAYLGGCDATSNVLAGQQFGISVKGTHAHSWVMSFDTEREAFDAYADALPNNVILLVDTYDTIEGVRNAIRTGLRLRENGHDLLGIRLDSGDLNALSRTARTLLDEAGFHETNIVASNDLDESTIRTLKANGAQIDTWGVGTNLVTAATQPALGGVYKMGAIRDEGGEWQYRIKLSNDPIKVSNPGILQIGRRPDRIHDILFNEIDTELPEGTAPLLIPFLVDRKRVRPQERLPEIRDRAQTEWPRLRDAEPALTLAPPLVTLKTKLLAEHGYIP